MCIERKRVIVEVAVKNPDIHPEKRFSEILDMKIPHLKFKEVRKAGRKEGRKKVRTEGKKGVKPFLPLFYGYPDSKIKKQLAEKKGEINLIVVAKIRPYQLAAVKDHENVINAYFDSRIQPHDTIACGMSVVGDIAKVIEYLEADTIWAHGTRGKFNGDHIRIGIVDTGVRHYVIGDSLLTDNGTVIGWYPEGEYPPGHACNELHGTLMSLSALAICPEAKIIDMGAIKGIRFSITRGQTAFGELSNAAAAYNWALTELPVGSRPHILSNSWGIRKQFEPDYAVIPEGTIFEQMFRKAIDAGVLVCFSAGNCGAGCNPRQCGSFSGPNQSIWGVTGLPNAITVGAATIKTADPGSKEKWIGLSSQGRAQLKSGQALGGYPKPDFCAPSQFKGEYLGADGRIKNRSFSGTSSSCAVTAGILGLLQSKKIESTPLPLSQSDAQTLLIDNVTSAKTIDPTAPVDANGWNQNWGYGMVNALRAYEAMIKPEVLTQVARRNEWELQNPPQPPHPGLCPDCLIATAAYESSLHPHVEALRSYRDSVILQSSFRLSFERLLNVYYKYSPFVAEKMKRSPTLKKLVKTTLVYPIVGLIKSLIAIQSKPIRRR